MAGMKEKAHMLSEQHLGFWCPACDSAHVLPVAGAGSWTWNGSLTHPTLKPSIKLTGIQPITDDESDRIMAGEKVEPRPFCCHSFVTDGKILFLPDCTHAMAGKTVELPAWPMDGGTP